MNSVITAGIVAAALLTGPAQTSAAPANEATAPARWAPRKLNFVYQGFTTLYTCDGLQDQMKRILKQLGAGDDLVLKPYGCTQLDGPEPTPGVYATFSVLEFTGTNDRAADVKGVAARWDTTTLDSDTSRQRNSGACELIEAVKQQVLPLFTTRNLAYSASCVPHQVSLAGAHLSAEVLRPVDAGLRR